MRTQNSHWHVSVKTLRRDSFIALFGRQTPFKRDSFDGNAKSLRTFVVRNVSFQWTPDLTLSMGYNASGTHEHSCYVISASAEPRKCRFCSLLCGPAKHNFHKQSSHDDNRVTWRWNLPRSVCFPTERFDHCCNHSSSLYRYKSTFHWILRYCYITGFLGSFWHSTAFKIIT